MSTPAFLRNLSPTKQKEIAPLVMLLLAAALIVIFAKIMEELLEGDLPSGRYQAQALVKATAR